MIVGRGGSDLANYIKENSGGSIEIDNANIYESFMSDERTLNSSLIIVDSLIYMVDEAIDIRKDLNVLFTLMQNKTFFNVKEIFVYAQNTDDVVRGMNQFETLMSELNYESYTIDMIDGEIPYSKIYNDITGITDEKDDKTSYKRVYRSVITEDSVRGYDPETFNRNILLKDENNVEVYEKAKETAVKNETGRVIKDTPELSPTKIDFKPKAINIDEIEYKKDIVIVTGRPKAGTSIFASVYAESLYKNKNMQINLIDLSETFGSSRQCIKRMKINAVDNKKLLLGGDFSKSRFNIFNATRVKEDLTMSYLKFILSIPNRVKHDRIIIDCNYSDLNEILDICGRRIEKVFICTQQTKDEVILIENGCSLIKSRNIPLFIYLNNSMKFDKSSTVVLATAVKSMIPYAKVISPLDFDEEVDLSSL